MKSEYDTEEMKEILQNNNKTKANTQDLEKLQDVKIAI